MKRAFTVLAALALLPSFGLAEETERVVITHATSVVTQATAPIGDEDDAPVKVQSRTEWEREQAIRGLSSSEMLDFLFAGPSMIQEDDMVTCTVDCHNGTMISCSGQECMVYDDGSGCHGVDDGTTYVGLCC